jgi:hypothetical protein
VLEPYLLSCGGDNKLLRDNINFQASAQALDDNGHDSHLIAIKVSIKCRTNKRMQ